MKLTLQLALVFVLGPLAGVLLTYSMAAFLAWDWGWAATADGGARFIFLGFAAIATLIGSMVGATIADAVD